MQDISSVPDKTTPKVFLIDDEKFVLEYVEKVIIACGYEFVGSAINGGDAIEELNKVDAELVIMDVSMPGMQGDELLNVLMRHFPDLKIIMLSSRNSIDLIKKCKESGAIGYVLKTGGFDYLVEKITKCWSKSIAS